MIFIGKYTYRNMNKKLIRLTESDLHRIVRESVNNVLTELDWKTYQNAAKKAHLKSLDDFPDGDEEGIEYGRKAHKFRKAAEDAFNRDYGVDDGRHYSKLRSDMHGSNTRAPGGGYFPFQDDSQVWIYDRNGGHTWGGMKFDQAIDDIAFLFEKSYMKKDTANKHEKAMKELDDYQRGKYNYDKEKGWHK